MAGSPESLTVEVVYATPERQRLTKIDVTAETTVREAVIGSALPREFPDVDFATAPLGVWGKPVAAERRVRADDRIEVYRPLLRDPREARRELAAAGRSMGRPAGGD